MYRNNVTLRWALIALGLLWIGAAGWANSDIFVGKQAYEKPELAERLSTCDGSFKERYDCKSRSIVHDDQQTFLLMSTAFLTIFGPPVLLWLAWSRLPDSPARPGAPTHKARIEPFIPGHPPRQVFAAAPRSTGGYRASRAAPPEPAFPWDDGEEGDIASPIGLDEYFSHMPSPPSRPIATPPSDHPGPHDGTDPDSGLGSGDEAQKPYKPFHHTYKD